MTLNKINANCNGITKRKKIKCLNTNVIYQDINSAATEFKVSITMIRSVIRGSRNLKNGFKFIYLDDYTYFDSQTRN